MSNDPDGWAARAAAALGASYERPTRELIFSPAMPRQTAVATLRELHDSRIIAMVLPARFRLALGCAIRAVARIEEP